jgi:hemerythrin-like metal-binding protein
MMDRMLTGLLPEALLIDQPEVDAQHEEIFTCIESLKIACVAGGNPDIGVFDDLLLFLGQHFATEERIAQEAALEFSSHAKIHHDSLFMLSKALDEVRRGANDVHSFLRFIEYWFERHIHTEDKLFGARLKAGPHSPGNNS